MEKEIQLPIIQRELKIPVKDVIFNETYNYVEIISGNVNIGSIPYIVTPGNLIYETDPSNTYRLKWDQVYFQNQETIDSMIKKVIGRDDIEITILTFRRLNVKEKETGSNICGVTCSYDGQWNVGRE